MYKGVSVGRDKVLKLEVPMENPILYREEQSCFSMQACLLYRIKRELRKKMCKGCACGDRQRSKTGGW
jgi:hypothetical protein